MEEKIKNKNKISSNLAKNMTLVILGVIFLLGCIGPFLRIFDMEGFALFIKNFALLYIPLITSIGANSAVEKVIEKQEKKLKSDKEEYTCKEPHQG